MDNIKTCMLDVHTRQTESWGVTQWFWNIQWQSSAGGFCSGGWLSGISRLWRRWWCSRWRSSKKSGGWSYLLQRNWASLEGTASGDISLESPQCWRRISANCRRWYPSICTNLYKLNRTPMDCGGDCCSQRPLLVGKGHHHHLGFINA